MVGHYNERPGIRDFGMFNSHHRSYHTSRGGQRQESFGSVCGGGRHVVHLMLERPSAEAQAMCPFVGRKRFLIHPVIIDEDSVRRQWSKPGEVPGNACRVALTVGAALALRQCRSELSR
jgi:hypothetical protein